ncbi:MAG: hypothetical protein JSV57_01000 [Candidatus Bathyarchaeota archaeon]|nr:MAG: hypothetical protein JSV57_01000 [Candidatus Bathyarchaeota archaeon]
MSRNHNLPQYDFAAFVTPNVLEPIAEDLWNIYGDEENFANGVLMILHQIPYNESDRRFPVETIVENQGDCDTFSYVAASIMMAGGLDVVLLYYEDERHMNVGVGLSQSPHDARSTAHYFSFEGQNYYVAECTGGNWQEGWRVGECPEEFESASAAVVTLEDCEQESPGQVSSSYDSPTSSSISLILSSMYVVRGSRVLISGSLSPPRSHRNITVYVRSDSSWRLLKVFVTDENGMYSSAWEPSSAGVYQIRASWSGDSEYASAESNVCTLVVTVNNRLVVVVVAAMVLGVVMVAVLLARESKSMIEAQPE